MKTCQQLLIDCIEFDEKEMAYDLLYLMNEGIVNNDTCTSQIDWNKVDKSVSRVYENNNILGFNIVDLYGALVYNDNTTSKWIMILAKSLEEARGYCLNKLGNVPKVIKFPKDKEMKSFWFPDENCYKSIYEIKKEKFEFPCEIFEYEVYKG